MDIWALGKDILSKTEGGLQIIRSLYPQAHNKRLFKLREERTASASLHRMPDGHYVVKDFGTGEKAQNALQLYAQENGLQFSEAVRILARTYGVENVEREKNAPVCEKNAPAQWTETQAWDENGFCFKIKDFEESDLNALGPWVDAEVCGRYALYALAWYAVRKEGKITKVSSTPNFPIFIFCFGAAEKKFYKMLQPRAEDKKWRFFWKGKKPADFIGGLAELKKAFFQRKEEAETSGEVFKKLDRAFLCSGERDALNMASMGEFVLWQNSETAELKAGQYKEIMRYVKTLYNIPDLDETGKRQGRRLAMKYLDIQTLWLPETLQQRRDWRGHTRKDLSDFFECCRHQPKKKMERRLHSQILKAYPMRFWDEQAGKDGVVRYSLNTVHLLYFLFQNGFCRLKAEEEKEGYRWIRRQNHVVREVKPSEIKDFVYEFLEQRSVPTPIRNKVYNSPRLSEPQLTCLPRVDLDFTDYSPRTQWLFFSHEAWQVSASGIKAYPGGHPKRYVWDKDIIDRRIEQEYDRRIDPKSLTVEPPYFSIKKTDFHYEVIIHEKHCEFLNFLIQTSRVHWQKELIEGWEDLEAKDRYREAHRFTLEGPRLSTAQMETQKAHFVNKVFVLGYLLHRYKHPNKAWAVYAMENAVADENESHGGTGKSIFLKAPGVMMNGKVLNARNRRMWDNHFLFDGVTKHTDYLLFDDADKYFNLTNLYASITGPLTVNPKHHQPFTLLFKDAPKFAVSSNYSLRNTDPSTTRRLLLTALSDYYHPAGEFFEEKRDPVDDFGHALFTDWAEGQWNKLFNFFAQCLQFYLSTSEKIDPPMEQLTRRNLLAAIGEPYREWAEEYAGARLDQEFNKKEAFEHLKATQDKLRNLSSHQFIKRLKAWCRLKGYAFMPPEKTDSQGRIRKRTFEGQIDYLFIASSGGEALEEEEFPF